jgi:hypothetical protein
MTVNPNRRILRHRKRLQFRHNNRREADIFGKAIAGPDAEALRLARASVDWKRRQRGIATGVLILGFV